MYVYIYIYASSDECDALEHSDVLIWYDNHALN